MTTETDSTAHTPSLWASAMSASTADCRSSVLICETPHLNFYNYRHATMIPLITFRVNASTQGPPNEAHLCQHNRTCYSTRGIGVGGLPWIHRRIARDLSGRIGSPERSMRRG